MSFFGELLRGAAAGAAGTTALNAVTFLDMAVRGRPASTTPQQTVERVAERPPVDVPGDAQHRDHRVSGLGSLSGLVTGVALGAALGLARAAGLRPPVPVAAAATAAAAMVGANGPMAALGVTDPRSWTATDWLADVVPHLAYGLVTAWTLEAMAPARR